MKTKKRTAGRPPVPPHLKRNKMTGIRIQQWLLDWLMARKGPKGKIVENLLIKEYKLKRPK